MVSCLRHALQVGHSSKLSGLNMTGKQHHCLNTTSSAVGSIQLSSQLHH